MDITERGEIALNNYEVNANVLIAKTDIKGKYTVVHFMSENYPKWNVSTMFFHDEELHDYIIDNFSDWFIDKLNGVTINTYKGYDRTYMIKPLEDMIEDISSDVQSHAADNDYNLLETEGVLEDAILESIAKFDYVLTKKMFTECYDNVYFSIM